MPSHNGSVNVRGLHIAWLSTVVVCIIWSRSKSIGFIILENLLLIQ